MEVDGALEESEAFGWVSWADEFGIVEGEQETVHASEVGVIGKWVADVEGEQVETD